MNYNSSSTLQLNPVDQTILSRKLTVVFLFVVAVVSSVLVLKTGNRFLIAGVVALPFGLILTSLPHFTLVVALIFNATYLPWPGLNAAKLGLLFQIILGGTYVMGLVLGSNQWRYRKTIEGRYLLAFTFVMLVIIGFRGIGLRALGSTTWGGQVYLALMISIFLFCVLSGFSLTKKHIRWIAWGGLVAGIAGTLISWATGGGGESVAEGMISDVEKSRRGYFIAAFMGLFPIVFAFKPRWARWPVFFSLLFICLAMIGLTGFRSHFVTAIMVVGAYKYFKSRNKVSYTVLSAFAGLILWGMIVVVSPMLPPALQRTISFIPGARVSSEVTRTASHSTEGRIELWKYTLSRSSPYMLLGRGVTIDVLDIMAEGGTAQDYRRGSQWFMYQTHGYHSGPLTLIVDFGILGAILYTFFAWFAVRRLWGYAKRLAELDSFESRFALFMCASMIVSFIAFYLLYGSSKVMATNILAFSVATVIAKSVLQSQNEQPAAATTQRMV